MLDSDESRKEVIRPDFNRAIMIDFQGAKITSDVGFLLVREIDGCRQKPGSQAGPPPKEGRRADGNQKPVVYQFDYGNKKSGPKAAMENGN